MSNIEILLMLICAFIGFAVMGLALLIGRDPDDKEGNRKKQKALMALDAMLMAAAAMPALTYLVIKIIYG